MQITESFTQTDLNPPALFLELEQIISSPSEPEQLQKNAGPAGNSQKKEELTSTSLQLLDVLASETAKNIPSLSPDSLQLPSPTKPRSVSASPPAEQRENEPSQTLEPPVPVGMIATSIFQNTGPEPRPEQEVVKSPNPGPRRSAALSQESDLLSQSQLAHSQGSPVINATMLDMSDPIPSSQKPVETSILSSPPATQMLGATLRSMFVLA